MLSDNLPVSIKQASKGSTMSDMTVMMSKKIFLEVCMGIEGLCAELYHYYSEIYEDIPEASRLWKKTALEEESHQRQFELALRLVNETEFEVSKDGLKRAYAIQYKLLKLLEHIKSNKPELLTAVSKAVEMENKLADLHVHTSLHFKEEAMQNLFKSLSDADRDHVSDMQRYRTILHLPLCEMEG
jgi:rubrerythrin